MGALGFIHLGDFQIKGFLPLPLDIQKQMGVRRFHIAIEQIYRSIQGLGQSHRHAGLARPSLAAGY